MDQNLILDPAIVVGARVRRTDGREGRVTRVLDREGRLGGLVEVCWDGQRRPSRSNGFEGGRDLQPIG